jgi:hypothetical protein
MQNPMSGKLTNIIGAHRCSPLPFALIDLLTKAASGAVLKTPHTGFSVENPINHQMPLPGQTRTVYLTRLIWKSNQANNKGGTT